MTPMFSAPICVVLLAVLTACAGTNNAANNQGNNAGNNTPKNPPAAVGKTPAQIAKEKAAATGTAVTAKAALTASQSAVDAAQETLDAANMATTATDAQRPALTIATQQAAAASKAAAETVAAIAASVSDAAQNAANTANPKPKKAKKGGKPAGGGGAPADAVKNSFWQGLGFGVGASLSVGLGGDDRIESASLDANDIVRVDKEQSAVAGIILESHYFGDCFAYENAFSELFETPDEEEELDTWFDDGGCGVGPFVAIHTSADDVIDAIGAGMMIGLKRTGVEDKTDTSSLNFGIGVLVDPEVTVLGSGLKENQPLPAGEEQIRTKEQHQVSLLFLASFAF